MAVAAGASERVRGALERARRLLDGDPARWAAGPLAEAVGLSTGQLHRGFRRQFGVSPAEYARALRTERARTSLAGGRAVTEALYEAGFGSSRAFYEVVPQALGMAPSQYRQGGAGATIRYTVFPCCLGQVLVATTGRGVCAVKIGDQRASLESQLRLEFPRAQLCRDEAGMVETRRAARALAEGRAQGPELPIDVHGTVFQWRVWREIQRIPRGATRTYSELAAALGRPRAARAVGRACASNQVALVIPCHRVVPSQGGEGGYRWGPERKRRLLEAESE